MFSITPLMIIIAIIFIRKSDAIKDKSRKNLATFLLIIFSLVILNPYSMMFISSKIMFPNYKIKDISLYDFSTVMTNEDTMQKINFSISDVFYYPESIEETKMLKNGDYLIHVTETIKKETLKPKIFLNEYRYEYIPDGSNEDEIVSVIAKDYLDNEFVMPSPINVEDYIRYEILKIENDLVYYYDLEENIWKKFSDWGAGPENDYIFNNRVFRNKDEYILTTESIFNESIERNKEYLDIVSKTEEKIQKDIDEFLNNLLENPDNVQEGSLKSMLLLFKERGFLDTDFNNLKNFEIREPEKCIHTFYTNSILNTDCYNASNIMFLLDDYKLEFYNHLIMLCDVTNKNVFVDKSIAPYNINEEYTVYKVGRVDADLYKKLSSNSNYIPPGAEKIDNNSTSSYEEEKDFEILNNTQEQIYNFLENLKNKKLLQLKTSPFYIYIENKTKALEFDSEVGMYRYFDIVDDDIKQFAFKIIVEDTIEINGKNIDFYSSWSIFNIDNEFTATLSDIYSEEKGWFRISAREYPLLTDTLPFTYIYLDEEGNYTYKKVNEKMRDSNTNFETHKVDELNLESIKNFTRQYITTNDGWE